jgi:DNA-binding MarR family transcriptional regulator
MQASGSSTERDAPAGDLDAVAGELGVLMKHLLGSSSRDFFSAIEEAGLTFTQVKCLNLLADAPKPLAQGALSETLGLSGPAISRALDGLVQRGEVKRTEDPRDRRSKLLTVSARGRRSLDRLIAIRLAAIKRFVAELSEEERESLSAGVAPIARRLTS